MSFKFQVRVLALAASALLAGSRPSSCAASVLTNCALVVQQAREARVCAEFDLTATVVARESDDDTGFGLTVFDGTSGLAFEPTHARFPDLRRGDTLRIRGALERNEYDEPIFSISNVSEIIHGPPPEPVEISAEAFKTGMHDNRLVRLTGVVRNVFQDDIDPRFQFLLLTAGRRTVYVAVPIGSTKYRSAAELLGATISVTGMCRRDKRSPTRQPYRRIERQLSLFPDGIRIVRPPQMDFTSKTDIATLTFRPPEDIPLDGRYRACGRVLAVWHGDKAVLQHLGGSVVRVQFAGKPLPRVGDSVEVVGFPESNLFVLGLTSSLWRPLAPLALPELAATNVTVRYLMEDGEGRPMVKVQYCGQPIRIEGQVHSMRGEGLDRRMVLAADGYLVPIDPGTSLDLFAGIPVGSRIAVTGTCVMDIDDWRPNATFPRVHGFSVVLRAPTDIVVVSRPSWWTPGKLVLVLFSVLAALLASALLNIVLKRRIERRSRQLESEIGARVASESKVKERTRLAVELHDAISQNLTGVAFQLQAVRNCTNAMPPLAARHLDVAEQSLGSCRDELRNCLWDLRNNALECADMNEAIRQTLAPHVGHAELAIRVNVARARLSDNIAHALLHIIRELAANAIRHGHATHVRVAGCIDGGRLLFSVTDNGCGFDPENCPGFEEGHFGLMGVRERLDGFEGELSIESDATGTKVTASMALPPETPDTDLRKAT